MELKTKTPVRYFVLLIVVLFLAACGGNADYSPKPRGYYRIVYPAKQYQPYTEGCPFTFDYPKYSKVEPDKSRGAKPCWQNIQFPQFNATLHLSYESITSKKEFNELIEDAHKLSFKHSVKATSIDEGVIAYPDRKVYGIYYTIDGNAASSAQFYLTDSTKHYLRGALYFNSEPRLDSIQPVLNFIKKDVDLMIKSFRWKN
ncbi:MULTISPECIES: gliding motility lipoprotein GldD [unclassified Mucilaginibacter]|uniref:gliding motility lipoprotein GldD n=1 Tax=unclassified Mucilaginibacter TaxID=2617802 RepID=UPI002AC9964D|nr:MULTISPECIES: gliding motility lipoprotein GldD [unclassified Mucilaginibacter]MEB0263776.1 gliding motility lipoprotein GldD [Mucilaginibacter sp. 10I4]MEB0280239.1 gliding motility lipoprotein GldD [Mucilaginibacter sp. 10B2]MEB0301138.1 gliding motility lipoprotein GldD [Mucilaginibacter sp. 5C4]WPX24352.1 gliding motility lipoprotein GldD [Mucilaginibacter sp. 5C4]